MTIYTKKFVIGMTVGLIVGGSLSFVYLGNVCLNKLTAPVEADWTYKGIDLDKAYSSGGIIKN